MDSYEKIYNMNYENASWIHKFIEYEGQNKDFGNMDSHEKICNV